MKNKRRRSREFALQGLYQWLLSGAEPATIAKQLAESSAYDKIDGVYFMLLLTGVVREADALGEAIAPCLDRKLSALSPVERAVIMMGGFELMHCPEVPYRVVINEAVDLAKSYGGTDGHKFVNGVLDKLAGRLRAPGMQT